MAKPSVEKKEAWMRLVVLIVTGIVLAAWKTLIVVLVILNWIITIFSGKRHKGMAELSEIWNAQVYDFLRYMAFVTNRRPFPFSPLAPPISKFE